MKKPVGINDATQRSRPANASIGSCAHPGQDRSVDGSICSLSGFGVGTIPSIILPKGGEAVQGIGERFSMNPITSGGSMRVPNAISPGRSDFSTQLSLGYDSGEGNSLPKLPE